MAASQLPALALGAAVLVASFWQTKIEKRAEIPLYSGPRFSVKLARYELSFDAAAERFFALPISISGNMRCSGFFTRSTKFKKPARTNAG